MCMMSVLSGYGKSRIADTAWTPQTWKQFKQVASEVDALDTALGEPECIDPEKDAWMKRIEERMQALEAAAFRGQE